MDAVLCGPISASRWGVSAYAVTKATGHARNAFTPAKDMAPLHLLCTICSRISLAGSKEIRALLGETGSAGDFAIGEAHLELLGHYSNSEDWVD